MAASVLKREVLYDLSLGDILNPSPLTTRFAFSPDGKRLLGLRSYSAYRDAPSPRIVIVENWFTELRERMGGN